MIIVNFSTHIYSKGQQRLEKSVSGYQTLMIKDYQRGWKTHKQSPYEFKINAIEKAFELDNVVLWADASLYVVGDLSKIENIILKDGYFMEEAGHYVGTWCNNHTRRYFNLTEEENKLKMFSAGLLGLDRRSSTAMEWFYQWKQSAKHGCFKGNWADHRHDMTCGSIIAERMKLKYQTGGTHMAYIGEGYPEPKEGVVFYCQGL